MVTQTVSTLMRAHGRASDVARELVRRRADLVSHARGSLEQHLVGVYEVLERWGQPERVRLAGLLHSGYSTESFGFRMFGESERPRIRELIGVDAERLVFAFGGCGRRELAEVARELREPVQIATRWNGATVALSRRDLAELLVIHAANLAEQTCRPGGGPAPWLADASRLVAGAREGVEIVPPIFGGATLLVSTADEEALLRDYDALLRAKSASDGGREAGARDALASSPVGEAHVIAGIWALVGHRGTQAVALGRRALEAFDSWAVAWDKRLSLPRWRELGELLVRDGQTRDRELEVAAERVRVVQERARGSPERIWAQLDALGALPRPSPVVAVAEGAADPDATALPSRFVQYLEGLRSNSERPMMQFYPGLRTQPWHDPRELPIVADLERLAPRIAEEARALENVRFQDEAEDIGRSGRWSVLFLLELGRRNEDNLARCPVTASVIDTHRTIKTSTGLVYFSCLDPRTRVAPHQGPTNLRLRCHLGLEVPEGCGMRVGGVTGGWREGRCTIFDDSFWHEVWNDSDQRRVVLVVDTWHPDLTDDEVSLLTGLQRYATSNHTGTQRGLARNDAARERALAAAAERRPVPAVSPPPLRTRRRA